MYTECSPGKVINPWHFLVLLLHKELETDLRRMLLYDSDPICVNDPEDGAL